MKDLCYYQIYEYDEDNVDMNTNLPEWDDEVCPCEICTCDEIGKG